ncbi:late secretory pathway protein avl9 [Podila humilis]|nr:late secretory pathway protein avl9 [Podila humilis]
MGAPWSLRYECYETDQLCVSHNKLINIDGSHQSDEDFTYFHLPPVKSRKDIDKTLFGISCNRQILTKDLLVKTDDVTRSSVQKAVVVLATQPIFGVLRQRLAVVTAAWFGQKDFTQTDILSQFYDSLNATITVNIPDSAFLMGTSLRELVKKFKYKVLVLLKLLLLERRVIFFGYPVETLCTYQYSLMSLVPGLLKSLQDTGSPLLDSQELYMQSMSKTPAHSTEKQELFKYLGLPLHIFGEGSFFQPYLPLQQIDILQDPRTRSYIIGTTNAIFLHNRDCGTDVIVNYTGSDDYLRAKFEEYLLTLLSSVKHSQFTQADDPIDSMGNPADRNMTSDYGAQFIRAWQQTPNYQLWNDFVDWELLNEIVAPGHPCQGNFSLAHVQRRLANQFKDMRIDKNFVPLKQSFSRAMTTSRERLSNVFDSVWQEFEKLQPEDSMAQEGSLEPSLYSTRTTSTLPEANKGLIQSTSSNPVLKPTARSLPDPEQGSEDEESNDAIVPSPSTSAPSSHRASPIILHSASQHGSRNGSLAGSPVSFTSTLGPATAATAALGQKAAGMFSNVSSFFQAKKKELLDAQREAEDAYQQRIHQHERKKKVMQERAKATASTFAISPKPVLSPRMTTTASPALGANSDEQQPTVYAYVSPRSPRRVSSSTSTTTTKTTVVPAAASSPLATTSAISVAANRISELTSPAATVAAPLPIKPVQVAEDVVADGSSSKKASNENLAESIPILSPVPITPVVLVPQQTTLASEAYTLPTLTRGTGSGGQEVTEDDDAEEDRGGNDGCGQPQEHQQRAIEEELLEALGTVDDSRLGAVASNNIEPSRSISPFTEISAPPSPSKGIVS